MAFKDIPRINDIALFLPHNQQYPLGYKYKKPFDALQAGERNQYLTKKASIRKAIQLGQVTPVSQDPIELLRGSPYAESQGQEVLELVTPRLYHPLSPSTKAELDWLSSNKPRMIQEAIFDRSFRQPSPDVPTQEFDWTNPDQLTLNDVVRYGMAYDKKDPFNRNAILKLGTPKPVFDLYPHLADLSSGDTSSWTKRQLDQAMEFAHNEGAILADTKAPDPLYAWRSLYEGTPAKDGNRGYPALGANAFVIPFTKVDREGIINQLNTPAPKSGIIFNPYTHLDDLLAEHLRNSKSTADNYTGMGYLKSAALSNMMGGDVYQDYSRFQNTLKSPVSQYPEPIKQAVRDAKLSSYVTIPQGEANLAEEVNKKNQGFLTVAETQRLAQGISPYPKEQFEALSAKQKENVAEAVRMIRGAQQQGYTITPPQLSDWLRGELSGDNPLLGDDEIFVGHSYPTGKNNYVVLPPGQKGVISYADRLVKKATPFEDLSPPVLDAKQRTAYAMEAINQSAPVTNTFNDRLRSLLNQATTPTNPTFTAQIKDRSRIATPEGREKMRNAYLKALDELDTGAVNENLMQYLGIPSASELTNAYANKGIISPKKLEEAIANNQPIEREGLSPEQIKDKLIKSGHLNVGYSASTVDEAVNLLDINPLAQTDFNRQEWTKTILNKIKMGTATEQEKAKLLGEVKKRGAARSRESAYSPRQIEQAKTILNRRIDALSPQWKGIGASILPVERNVRTTESEFQGINNAIEALTPGIQPIDHAGGNVYFSELDSKAAIQEELANLYRKHYKGEDVDLSVFDNGIDWIRDTSQSPSRLEKQPWIESDVQKMLESGVIPDTYATTIRQQTEAYDAAREDGGDPVPDLNVGHNATRLDDRGFPVDDPRYSGASPDWLSSYQPASFSLSSTPQHAASGFKEGSDEEVIAHYLNNPKILPQEKHELRQQLGQVTQVPAYHDPLVPLADNPVYPKPGQLTGLLYGQDVPVSTNLLSSSRGLTDSEVSYGAGGNYQRPLSEFRRPDAEDRRNILFENPNNIDISEQYDAKQQAAYNEKKKKRQLEIDEQIKSAYSAGQVKNRILQGGIPLSLGAVEEDIMGVLPSPESIDDAVQVFLKDNVDEDGRQVGIPLSLWVKEHGDNLLKPQTIEMNRQTHDNYGLIPKSQLDPGDYGSQEITGIDALLARTKINAAMPPKGKEKEPAQLFYPLTPSSTVTVGEHELTQIDPMTGQEVPVENNPGIGGDASLQDAINRMRREAGNVTANLIPLRSAKQAEFDQRLAFYEQNNMSDEWMATRQELEDWINAGRPVNPPSGVEDTGRIIDPTMGMTPAELKAQRAINAQRRQEGDASYQDRIALEQADLQKRQQRAFDLMSHADRLQAIHDQLMQMQALAATPAKNFRSIETPLAYSRGKNQLVRDYISGQAGGGISDPEYIAAAYWRKQAQRAYTQKQIEQAIQRLNPAITNYRVGHIQANQKYGLSPATIEHAVQQLADLKINLNPKNPPV